MLWSRIAPLLSAALLLAACGFEPLYGGGGRGVTSREMAAVRVEPIADRVGQQLRNELFDLLTPLGQSARPEYQLTVTLTESTSGLAVKKSEVATRSNLTLNASFTLSEAKTGIPLFSDSNSLVGSYNVLTSDFSTLVAEQGVRDRLVKEMARDIQIRLSAYFKLQKPHQEKAVK